jgi:prepilin-type N-terminal cleavage/methylation domain-containing protein
MMKYINRYFSKKHKRSESVDNQLKLNRGFTLIELLTVIAIIAVLGAIIVPAVSRVRASAESTQCVSNLRTMQLANQMYASENKNKFVSIYEFDDEGEFSSAWHANKKYFEKLTSLRDQERGWGEWEDDLLCPTTRSMGSDDWNVLGSNYGMAYELICGELGLPTWNNSNANRAILVNKIENPAETVAFADCTNWLLKDVTGYSYEDEDKGIVDPDAGYLAYRHNGRANAVNFDASVSSYTVEDMNDPKILKRFTLAEAP